MSHQDFHGQRRGQRGSKDITSMLRDWEYDPGSISVRRINGLDGTPKLQLRLDLGLLQMELSGRPDGLRPFGYESLLEYFEDQLADYQRRNGTVLGFEIDAEECQALRDEAAMYAHRYLGLFVLGDYEGAVRDTQRNLRVLELCQDHAADDQDRFAMEQYRPYILMMNARARASIVAREKRFAEALAIVRVALRDIRRFYAQFGTPAMYRQSGEVEILKQFGRELRAQVPVDPVRNLEARLRKAIRREHYEEAAELRDAIAALRRNSAA